MKFKCTKCGCCCRRVNLIPGFPEAFDEKGVCIHLNEENQCSIYETRPLICRVDSFVGDDATHEEKKVYYQFTNSICNQWILADQVGENYLIDIFEYNQDFLKTQNKEDL